ncbi:(d)CMP kinase [Bacillaceae bacterium Marseille-Q3522]|nr:(d)CMP kinase [Bacillaceae bacterium Marseille-Q3522]
MNKKISIAIDGPAAAGKSTVAKLVAERLGYIYIDTGAMYRAFTYLALTKDANLENEEQLRDLLQITKIALLPGKKGQVVLLNGKDISKEIRTASVTNAVSIVAKHGEIRKEMVKRQQELSKHGGVVMDGRDIGTKVLPNAEVKIFLQASVEERAQRRHLENLQKGFPSNLEKLKTEITLRDKLDSEREVSPLRKADDAIEVDTTSLDIKDVVNEIMGYIRKWLQ